MARILVLDDNRATRARIVRLLQAGGHETVAVSNAAEWIRMIEHLSVDTILVNGGPPSVPMVETLHSLRG